MFPRHRSCNRFFCNFYGFLDYLIGLNDVGNVGSHTLKSGAKDLQSLLFIKFHDWNTITLNCLPRSAGTTVNQEMPHYLAFLWSRQPCHLQSMNLTNMLSELRSELQQIDEAILVLLRLAGGGAKRRGRPPKWMSSTPDARGIDATPVRRKRKPFSAETKKKMGEDQRLRWAKLRRQKAA